MDASQTSIHHGIGTSRAMPFDDSGPLQVKGSKVQTEQMFSALHLKANARRLRVDALIGVKLDIREFWRRLVRSQGKANPTVVGIASSEA